MRLMLFFCLGTTAFVSTKNQAEAYVPLRGDDAADWQAASHVLDEEKYLHDAMQAALVDTD